MSKDRLTFEGSDLTVHWDKNTCIHSAVCVKNLNRVFKPGERPWIKVDEASAQELMDVIDKCPSKALSYEKKG